jgi:hypothetical protein
LASRVAHATHEDGRVQRISTRVALWWEDGGVTFPWF